MKKIHTLLLSFLVLLSTNTFAGDCEPWYNSKGLWQGKGRIVISSDGNEHDHDDWAATPFSLALLASKGLQDKLVLYTFSDHVWGSNEQHADAKKQMQISALEGKEWFGFNNTEFIEAVANKEKAYNAMRDAINASSANDPLIIIGAGPMHVIGEGLNRAEKSKRQYVTLVSHSTWNNNHQHNGSYNWAKIKNEFNNAGGGNLKMVLIADQNGGDGYDGMRALIKKFDWIKTSPARDNPLYKKGAWDWLYERQETCIKKSGTEFDPSDAGMIIYLLTGIQKTEPSDAKNLMESPVAPCGGDVVLPKDCAGVEGGSGYMDDCNECVGGTTGKTACVPAQKDCYGVENGNAYLDDCGICVGGTTGKTPCDPSSGDCTTYGDKNGFIIMEAENTKSALGEWIKKKDVSGYTGSGHLEFTGNGINGGTATSPLQYKFTVKEGGDYRLVMRARKRLEGAESDKCNDGYVKVAGDFTAGNTTATTEMLKKNMKFFGGSANGWGWAVKLDEGHVKHEAVYKFKAGETYTLTMSGRSIRWNVDRIIFYKDSKSLTDGQNAKDAETFTCGGAANFDCNGDENGSAYLDNCGICVGGNTGKTACADQGGDITDITDLKASKVSCNSVTLTWSDVNGEDAYRVRRKLTTDATYINLKDIPAGSISYTDNTVAENSSYIYQVRPVQGGTAVKASNTPTVAVPKCGTTEPGGDCSNVTIKAIDFSNININGFSPAYIDANRGALAINAAKYPGETAAATETFAGETGTYDITITSMLETDGECKYTLKVAGTLIGSYSNIPTTTDYKLYTHTFEGVSVTKGDKIQVEFNSHSNGTVPEGEGFAYARGRWTEIKFVCLGETAPVQKDCAGTENGTAFIDDCGECVGGTTGKTACVPDNGDCTTYGDKNGFIIMEAENTSSPLGKWIKKKDVSGYTGSGHLEFTGNGESGGSATSPLQYTFKVKEGGDYRLVMRARKRLEGAESDKCNDGYVKVAGDFVAGNTTATTSMLKNNMKFFGGSANGWGWAVKLDEGHVKHEAVYKFKAGETYTLTMSGRSIRWNVDRIIFYKDSKALTDGQNAKDAETFSCDGTVLPKDCNGEAGGTASIDACGICSGGNTGITPSTVPDVTVTKINGTCGNAGSITMTFPDTDNRTQIEFSIDGGVTYPVNVKDDSDTYTFADLAAGDYTVFARWGNDECPVDLGKVSITADPLPAATITAVDPSCGVADGSITLVFVDTDGRNDVEFSIDGGVTFPVNVPDISGSYTFENMAAGDYTIFIRWGNNDCPVELGTVTLTETGCPAEITQTITLTKGWNLVSFYVEMPEEAIETILPNAETVKNFDGFYKKGQEPFLNSIQKLESGVGYMIYNSIDETITLTGLKVTISPFLNLSEGWNLIPGFAVDKDLDSITKEFEIIKNFNGFYQKGGEFNSITKIKKGQAYLLKK